MDSQGLTGLKECETSFCQAQGLGYVSLKTLDDLNEMCHNPCNNKGKRPFFDLQRDDPNEEKIHVTRTMMRNLRRSKARTFCKAMKEKLATVDPHETPVHMWYQKVKLRSPTRS